MRLVAQHKDTSQLAQQIHHVLNFCHWAISSGSSTALLYSKRLVCFFSDADRAAVARGGSGGGKAERAWPMH